MIRSALLTLGAAFTLAYHAPSWNAGLDAAALRVADTCAVDLATTEGLTVVNRTASPLREEGRTGLRLDARPGDGVAWLEGCSLSEGILEFEVRGKDVQGQSFVGVAFHGVDDSTYEAVYLRPFNFRAEDPVRRGRAVQYISHPTHTWSTLRETFPEVYENPVQPAPDPNDWVHVRVVVAGPEVRVFVGEGEEADLVVDRLGSQEQGMVGLWVGNGSGGDFADLVIKPAP